MIRVIQNTTPIVQLTTEISYRELLPKPDVTIKKNENSIDSLSRQYESSCLTHDNVCSDGLIILWLGEKDSTLRTALLKYLNPEDINLILFSSEEQLWYWLNTHSSSSVASLLIETNHNIQDIVRRSNAYANIRSILIRCSSNDLNILQRCLRSYNKIDGIFADDIRLLLKLVIDLALYSEEIGDQQRENENNELNAQRNYNRALQLCALARRL